MTTPARSFTPGPSHYPGEYRVSRGAGGEPFAIEGKSRTLALVKTCGDHTEANANLFAASARLYAYAKAVELRDAWIEMDDDETDSGRKAYHAHLLSMGWNESEFLSNFLATYRAAALAQAEGRNP